MEVAVSRAESCVFILVQACLKLIISKRKENVTYSSVREGQRIAPEEPLEGCDGGGHDTEPNEGEGGFPPCEARVKEPVQACET